jgi:superoxide dismutase, Cu-Zn family
MRHAVLLAAVLALLTTPVGAQERKADAPEARAEMKNAEGKTVGQATLEETPHGVLIRVNLTDLEPGPRAFHIHEVGKCDPPKFESAGGHFNPGGRKHGFHNPDGAHAGDLPNLHVPDTRRLTVEVLAREVSLGGSRARGNLLAGNGTALVVHAGVDDYKTDPTGDAGGRIACGVIQR